MIGEMVLHAYRLSRRIRAKIFSRLGGGAFHDFGANSIIDLPIRLGGERRISIGRDVFIGANSWLQVIPQPGDDSTEPVITIGDGTCMAGFCTISAVVKIVIEADVLFARQVYIADHTHVFSNRTKPILEQGITKAAKVLICEGAWLGQGVVICPGVTIGRGAVVGANSVVRQDVPDFCVAAGAPARILRTVDQGAILP